METPDLIKMSIENRGMGVLNGPPACPSSHLHPSWITKYLRFAHRFQLYQFTSLTFGLATAPQVIIVIVKELKVLALSKGVSLHQYTKLLIDQSSVSRGDLTQLQHCGEITESLVWIINQGKLQLTPTQVFSFVGYQYHLSSALVKPTQGGRNYRH